MIGSGLKKLAQEKGMQIAKGVAYGSLEGFSATLSEGSGYKSIVFSTLFPDPAGKGRMLDAVNAVDMKKTYRVVNLQFSTDGILVVFQDTVGTMKKIYAFLDWFIPLLRQNGATGVDICTACGLPITGGSWVLVNGTAFHFHEGCAQKNEREVAAANAQRAEAAGSYPMGLLGALLGAALGAVVWAIVLNLGYVASLVGLLIGFLAEKGYNLLKGKQGKGKVPVLILAVVFGVLLGTFAADAISLGIMIQGGELPGFGLGDIPAMIVMLLGDPEYRSITLGNVLMGLLFAGLGVFGILRRAGKAVADDTYVKLN